MKGKNLFTRIFTCFLAICMVVLMMPASMFISYAEGEDEDAGNTQIVAELDEPEENGEENVNTPTNNENNDDENVPEEEDGTDGDDADEPNEEEGNDADDSEDNLDDLTEEELAALAEISLTAEGQLPDNYTEIDGVRVVVNPEVPVLYLYITFSGTSVDVDAALEKFNEYIEAYPERSKSICIYYGDITQVALSAAHIAAIKEMGQESIYLSTANYNGTAQISHFNVELSDTTKGLSFSNFSLINGLPEGFPEDAVGCKLTLDGEIPGKIKGLTVNGSADVNLEEGTYQGYIKNEDNTYTTVDAYANPSNYGGYTFGVLGSISTLGEFVFSSKTLEGQNAQIVVPTKTYKIINQEAVVSSGKITAYLSNTYGLSADQLGDAFVVKTANGSLVLENDDLAKFGTEYTYLYVLCELDENGDYYFNTGGVTVNGAPLKEYKYFMVCGLNRSYYKGYNVNDDTITVYAYTTGNETLYATNGILIRNYSHNDKFYTNAELDFKTYSSLNIDNAISTITTVLTDEMIASRTEKGTLTIKCNSITDITISTSQLQQLKPRFEEIIIDAKNGQEYLGCSVEINDDTVPFAITKLEVTKGASSIFADNTNATKIVIEGTTCGTIYSVRTSTALTESYGWKIYKCVDAIADKWNIASDFGSVYEYDFNNEQYYSISTKLNDAGTYVYAKGISDNNYYDPNSANYPELVAPIGLEWATDAQQSVNISGLSTSTEDYRVVIRLTVYKNGQQIHNVSTASVKPSEYSYSNYEKCLNYFINHDLREYMNESATYTVTAQKYVTSYDGEYWELTPLAYGNIATVERTYIRPAKSAPKAQLHEIEGKPGQYTFEGVNGYDKYVIALYGTNDEMSGWNRCSRTYGNTGYDYYGNTVDFSRSINGNNYYTRYKATIMTLSNNINVEANSEEAECMGTVDVNQISQQTTQQMTSVVNDAKAAVAAAATPEAKKEAAQNAVNNLIESLADASSDSVSLEELAVGMQHNTSTVQQVKELEEIYAENCNVSVEAPTVTQAVSNLGINTSSIKMTGAALNVRPNQSVSLDVSVPKDSEQKKIDTTKYTGGVQLDIKLNVSGEVTNAELKVPIQITMPIPAGVKASGLTILHYHNDGSPEIINPIVNSDGTMTFTITKFSTFVVTNTVGSAISEEETESNETYVANDFSSAAKLAASASRAANTASGKVIVWGPLSDSELAKLTEAAKKLNSNAIILTAADYNAVGGLAAGGEDITIKIDGVSKGDNIYVIHDGKSGLETIKAKEVGDGYITVFLKDLSPIAVVKLPSGAKSPKTGEITLLEYLITKAVNGK